MIHILYSSYLLLTKNAQLIKIIVYSSNVKNSTVCIIIPVLTLGNYHFPHSSYPRLWLYILLSARSNCDFLPTI